MAILLACPTFATDRTSEQKRLLSGGQVFKEIMDIPDGIPKDLQARPNRYIALPQGSTIDDWLRLEAVAQIEFLEWTETHRLRHSKFVGPRDDKVPRKVVKEHAVEA